MQLVRRESCTVQQPCSSAAATPGQDTGPDHSKLFSSWPSRLLHGECTTWEPQPLRFGRLYQADMASSNDLVKDNHAAASDADLVQVCVSPSLTCPSLLVVLLFFISPPSSSPSQGGWSPFPRTHYGRGAAMPQSSIMALLAPAPLSTFQIPMFMFSIAVLSSDALFGLKAQVSLLTPLMLQISETWMQIAKYVRFPTMPSISNECYIHDMSGRRPHAGFLLCLSSLFSGCWSLAFPSSARPHFRLVQVSTAARFPSPRRLRPARTTLQLSLELQI